MIILRHAENDQTQRDEFLALCLKKAGITQRDALLGALWPAAGYI